MTKNEILNLPHLAIAEETKFIHLHAEEGYMITPWNENMDIKEYSASVCYYMPIKDEYPDYHIITVEKNNEIIDNLQKWLKVEELLNKQIDNE